MKKIIGYFIIPMVLASLVSCSNTNNSSSQQQGQESTSQSDVVDSSSTTLEGLNGTFESTTFIYDGSEKELVYSNLPAGYRAEYENNKATEQGRYKATCKIYDGDNKLVETLYAIMTIDYPENAAFEYYLDTIFIDFMGNDYISWNIFTKNPENFNLKRDPADKATWYSYEPIPDGYKEAAFTAMKSFKAELEYFKDKHLSYNQIVSYELMENYFNENIAYYDPANTLESISTLRYVDSFGGYAADFPTYIEAYSLRTEQDVIDVLDYIASLPTAFASYNEYVQDRIDAGYPLSDYTLDEMVTYLNNVIEGKDDYYLNDIIKTKIDECSFLDANKKTEYKEDVDEYMTSYFFPAHTDLATSLLTFKGNCSNDLTGYWASYGEKGVAEFEHNLKYILGLPDLDMDEYNAYLDEKIAAYSSKFNGALGRAQNLSSSDYNLFVRLTGSESVIGITDPNEMIGYLKEFATTIVPELEVSPNITVKYMDDATAASSNALAYYMKSALDNDENEYITLNPITSLESRNDALGTMAHEGYPGHMYAYMFSKQLDTHNISKILTNLAHGEGWATYVELKLYEYIKTHNNYPNKSKVIKIFCDYMYYMDLLSYLAYTKIDMMIHYEHKTISEIANFLGKLGFNEAAAADMYSTLIEMPGTYAAYGFGRSFFLDLHTEAKEALGKAYSEIDFNAALLSNGWCALSKLIEIKDQYIEETAFLNGITLEESE